MKRSGQAREIVTTVCTYIITKVTFVSKEWSKRWMRSVKILLWSDVALSESTSVYLRNLYSCVCICRRHVRNNVISGLVSRIFRTLQSVPSNRKICDVRTNIWNIKKIVDWLKELIQRNDYEPEIKSEILISHERQEVQGMARTNYKELYISKWRTTREPCKKNTTI